MKIFTIILISLLVLIVGFVYIVFNYPKAEPEIFLIPEKYVGEVIVVFDRKDGETVEFENDKRIYRIPQSGILFTKFEYNPGVINQEYYFVDSLGKRHEIEYRPFMDGRDKYKHQPDRIGIHRLPVEFYGTDSCRLKTDQLIVSSHRQFHEFSCYDRMIEVVDTICQ
jgi:hypothetical protein